MHKILDTAVLALVDLRESFTGYTRPINRDFLLLKTKGCQDASR